MTRMMRCAIGMTIVCACASSAAAEIFIETVSVESLGNSDHFSGRGAVDYRYDMGKFEVTAAQYTAFLNAVAATDTYGLYNPSMFSTAPGCKIERSGSPGSYTYSVAPEWANRPVNYVSFGDAARFTNWLENDQPIGAQGLGTTEDGSYFLNGAMSDAALSAVTRKADARWVIPSGDEWTKSGYHKNDGPTGNYWDYPTGTNDTPTTTIWNPDRGNGANFFDIENHPFFLTEVGEYENSASPYGTFDQGGNVEEWQEDLLSGTDRRAIRGASYASMAVEMTAQFENYVPSTTESAFIGFRVALIPEPASIVFLAMVGLGIVRRR